MCPDRRYEAHGFPTVIGPIHALFFGSRGRFLQPIQNLCGAALLPIPMSQEGDLRFVEQPILLPVSEGLLGEELGCLQGVTHLRHIPIEAAYIEVVNLSARWQGFAPLRIMTTKPFIILFDLLIQIAQGLDNHLSLCLVVFDSIELRQLCQEFQHRHGDVSTGRETFEPTEAAILVLQLLQLAHRQLTLVVSLVQVKQ